MARKKTQDYASHHARQKPKNPGRRGREPDLLSDKMVAVLDHYFLNGCLSKRKAMLAGGYSDCDTGRFFALPQVQKEMAIRQKAWREEYGLNEEWVIKRLMVIADGNLGDIIVKLKGNGWNLADLTLEERFVLGEFSEEEFKHGRGEDAELAIKRKIKTRDQLPALVALSRKLGLFQDNVNVTGADELVARLQAGRDRAAKEGE